jgi:hypothetical protein
MNVDDLQNKLIAAARQVTPSEAVPYGFERRVMARLRAMSGADRWGGWAQALWRAAGPCVAVALVLTVLSFFTKPGSSTGSDLSQDFENTVLAAANLEQPPPDSIR